MSGAFNIPRAAIPDPAQYRNDPSRHDPSTDGSLLGRFVVPPFSILDSRQGYWQERRRWWLSLGIQSELGRGDALLELSEQTERAFEQDLMRRQTRQDADRRSNLKAAPLLPEWASNGTVNMAPGTSVFDPVLCEIMYRWFCPPDGAILDPFAGGSVRGIVAAYLGHPYVGVDLSERQVGANRVQATDILTDGQPSPVWFVGDSRDVLPTLSMFDFVFSCPPYFDLEVYSDDPRDLSVVTWPEFQAGYADVIEKAVARLHEGRFACFVVSEVRDAKTGLYRGLVPYTIECFERAGARYYNEAILVNTAGSLPIRVTRQFEAGRKLGRTHQNVLIFLKGDSPRGWSYERAAPPDPQQALFADAEAPLEDLSEVEW